MRRYAGVFAALALILAIGPAATGAGGPPQGTQSNAAFESSYANLGVSSTSVTSQQRSCYTPDVYYTGALDASDGYRGGGSTLCPGATTGEDTGPFELQDVSNPSLLVKDHSESDIRVDPNDTKHVIGQSKWFVNAEGYNHLSGFYESTDGGEHWSVQGHVPGYEAWTDNTDPVGAFDPYGTTTPAARARGRSTRCTRCSC